MKGMSTALALATITALASPARALAMDEAKPSGFTAWVAEHRGHSWSGESELWVDPSGNDADTSDATLSVLADGIVYTWEYRGSEQTGTLRWTGEALNWKDSWHQPENVALAPVSGHGSLVAGAYSYRAGTGPDWHWRIKLSERPDGTLVLQMTNIAPWGEEARAVRIVLRV